MRARLGDVRRVLVVALGAALAIALNLAAQSMIATAEPFTDFGRLVLGAGVGSVYAICAVVAAASRAPGSAVLMLAGAVSWPLGTFAAAIQPTSSWWVPLYALASDVPVIVTLLILAFPTGRIVGLVPRLVLGVTVVFLATRTLVRLLAENGDWCLCTPNPLQVLPVSVAREWYRIETGIAVALAVAALAALSIRWIRGSHPWRATNVLMTLVAVGIAIVTATTGWALLTSFLEERPGPAYLRGALAAAVPIVYVAGLATQRQARARVADVLLAARSGVTRSAWDDLVRQALDDRGARLLWLSPDGRYLDREGSPASDDRARFAVGDADPPEVLIQHDPALASRTELLASLAASITMIRDNERLTAELERSLVRVRESRARLVDAGDVARRRLERDLHDGAQQLLLTAAMTLERAGRRAEAQPDVELRLALRDATEQLRLARRELRELARGITPAILDHGGLTGAVEELALRSAVPAVVTVHGDDELDDVIAKTAYLAVAEALTNIAKHAGAQHAQVEVTIGDDVRIEVVDDGVGGAELRPFGGLRGLADRVEAVGGSITVSAAVPVGTTVTVRLPRVAADADRTRP